jgi:hypothetical protein
MAGLRPARRHDANRLPLPFVTKAKQWDEEECECGECSRYEHQRRQMVIE